jgi:hypothetical protein
MHVIGYLIVPVIKQVQLKVDIHMSINASFYFYVLQLLVLQDDIHYISFFQNIDEMVVEFRQVIYLVCYLSK